MQKFVPCIWLDSQAEDAAAFYLSAFKSSKVEYVSRYLDNAPKPAGSVLTVRLTLDGQEFDLLNGGLQFKITPAISFYVDCETAEEIDSLWAKLGDGGIEFMELQEYPFSEKFGWIQDKFGVSWQVSLSHKPQSISPFFMFCREQHGRALEAMQLYTSIFPNSKIEVLKQYGKDEAEPEGTVFLSTFSLDGQQFMAIDSGAAHQFTFSEALSIMVCCENQVEIDDIWDKLTANGGEESRCGWLKDKFGVSWQIVSRDMDAMLLCEDKSRVQNMMNEMFTMNKLDVAALKQAFDGK